MQNNTRFKITLLYAIAFFAPGLPGIVSADQWSLKDGRPWSRDVSALVRLEEKDPHGQGKSVIRLEHRGKQDWSFSDGARIAVQAGELYRIRAEMAFEAIEGAQGHASISVVTRKSDGEVVHWSFGSVNRGAALPARELRSEFMIPPGIASIEPRVTGYGPGKVRIDGFSLEKIGRHEFVHADTPLERMENTFLEIQVDTAQGLFSVTDKRTGRRWSPLSKQNDYLSLALRADSEASLRLLHAESLREIEVSLHLEQDRPELTLRLDSQGPMPRSISYPPPFGSKPGDRLVLPVNEGIGLPVDEKNDPRIRRLIAYGGHGICMAFWAQIEDATGSGMMGILETPDDAAVEVDRAEGGLYHVGVCWDSSMKEFRYPRRVRFVFLDRGGHVAACKRYREHAQALGLWVPFTEKVKRNPNIDLLLGAANIWCWEGGKVALVKEMKQAGIDRILWSAGGSAEELAEINALDHVLTSRYDIYQDIMDPARFDEVAYVHGDWTTEAWPRDINWTDPDGNWRKGWAVGAKDKTKPRISCAVICDARALPYARKRISEELNRKPYRARFLDTTVASPWFECYHPDHPMTRSDSRHYKMKLLKLIGEFGLVCGSETGHDASVPYCDYFEGMLSLGPYRVHESGRNMIRLVEEVPPQIERFQVNPAVRLPLWELVYHDCTVAQWYWGDYNNKLPKVWRQRDLFNALYGTPPMYMFTRKYWNENKERFVESYKTAATTARATAYAEMTDHRFLTPDRLVQQTVFSNGVTVTVNFDTKARSLPDGSSIGGLEMTMQ